MLLELDNCVLKEDLGVILKRDKRLSETITSEKGDFEYTFPVRTRKYYNTGRTRIISVQAIRSMVDYDKSVAMKAIISRLDSSGIDWITEIPVLCGPDWKGFSKKGNLPRSEDQRSMFCLDIYLPEYNTVIEYDSKTFHSSRSAKKLDRARDSYLKHRFPGLRIIRISESGRGFTGEIEKVISSLVPSTERISGEADVLTSLSGCYGQSLRRLNDNCRFGCYAASSKGLGVDKILLSALDDYEKHTLDPDKFFYRLNCFLDNLKNKRN